MSALETAPAVRGAPGKRQGGRAGRNLPAAIAVGLLLGAAVSVPLFSPYRWAFVAVVAAAVALGIYEIVQSLRTLGADPSMTPLLVGGTAMVLLPYREGSDALFLALVLTVLACLAWRLADPAEGFLRDVAASTLTAAYVPFLAAFAVLLAVPETLIEEALRLAALYDGPSGTPAVATS